MVVDDGNAGNGRITALAMPLILEHAHNLSLEIPYPCSLDRAFDLSAAGELGAGKERIEEGAARVRVDLDQLWAIIVEVEIIAHEGAERPMVLPCDLWCP